MPLVYTDLRRQAEKYLRGERPGHTLQATALVHEAYMRLVDIDRISWSDRTHFLAVAATCMRRILVSHARKRKAAKRGDGACAVTLVSHDAVSATTPDELLALDDAINRLAAMDARKARVVELRLFSGLENAKVAEVVGISLSTVERDWRFSKAWLHREMLGGE